MPKIFFLVFRIPAMLFDEPFGFEFFSIFPFLLQYLNAIKLLFSRFFNNSLFAK